MCVSMVDIQSATAENKQGKREEERRNHRTKIEGALLGGHNSVSGLACDVSYQKLFEVGVSQILY